MKPAKELAVADGGHFRARDADRQQRGEPFAIRLLEASGGARLMVTGARGRGGSSSTTSFAGLSSRKPRKLGWRRMPSSVNSE